MKVLKSPGVQTFKTDLDNHYVNYFRGKHYQAFSRNEQIRRELELEEYAVRNELEPQPELLPLDTIKIFEIRGETIPLSALPAGCTEEEQTTNIF